MSVVDNAEDKPLAGTAENPSDDAHADGLLGRLGAGAARRFRLTLVLWLARVLPNMRFSH